MESRLLHFTVNTGPSDRRLDTAALPSTREQLRTMRTVRDAQQQEQAERFGEDPKIMYQKMLLEQGPAMIDRMKNTSAAYRPLIEGTASEKGQEPQTGIRTTLLQAVGDGHESFNEELSAIMDAIVEIPDYDEAKPEEHRYLTTKRISNRDEENPQTVTYFETKYAQMKQDRERLEQLKAVYPQYTAQMTTLQQAIDGLARANPGFTAQQSIEGKVSFTDQAFKHFGKTMGFGALALAGVLFTVVAVINKKFDWKPLLALAGAALVASPELRRMLFGGKFDQQIAEVNQSINKDTLALMTKYSIEGDAWTGLVERMQEKKNDDIDGAIAALEKGGNTFLTDEELEPLALKLLPGDTTEAQTARGNLQQMMKEGQFPNFVRSMRATGSQEAQQTVQAFIAVGSAKTAKALQAAEIVQEERVRQEQFTKTTATTSEPPSS